MSEKSTLEIFKLCKRLCELLGEEDAVADLRILYERHPEMFKDMQDVKSVITQVVSTEESKKIIINPKAKNEKDFLVSRELDNRKTGDIGIRNDEGTNVIFHANKINTDKFNRSMKNKQVSVETPSSMKLAPTWSDHCADKPLDLPKCDKAPSTPARDSIPKNIKQYSQTLAEHEQILKAEIQEIKAKDPKSPLLESKRRELTNIQKLQAEAQHKDSSKPKAPPKKSQGRGM